MGIAMPYDIELVRLKASTKDGLLSLSEELSKKSPSDLFGFGVYFEGFSFGKMISSAYALKSINECMRVAGSKW